MKTCLRSYMAGIILSVAAMLDAPAFAAECMLSVFADLPVKMEGLRAAVPVQVNGQDVNFWPDSGAFFSLMSEAKAKELNLPLEALPPGFYVTGMGGTASVQLATIKSFGIVGQQLKNLQFLAGGTDSGGALIGLKSLRSLMRSSISLMAASSWSNRPGVRKTRWPIGRRASPSSW